MTDDRHDSNAERLAWEHEQREYAQRVDDAMDATEILLWLIGFLVFVGCWHLFVEWAFGMFP